MALIDILLPEFDHEIGATRRLLDRVPDASFGWAPHTRSTTLGALVTHLATLPGWTRPVMTQSSIDIAAIGGGPTDAPADMAGVLALFDRNVADARGLLLGAIDGTLLEPWTLRRGSEDVFTMPRIGMLRYVVLNHLIHHRGQLTVYLRLQNVSLPAIYGPSADEGPRA